MAYSILTINPGSTSTKLGLFRDTEEVLTESISHSTEELAAYPSVADQLDYRLKRITEFFAAHQLSGSDFAAVVGRGGLLKPVVSGTYRVNDAMLDDLKAGRYGAHASNLGAILAAGIAAKSQCPAFIVDPVVVDELDPVARLTGRPEISRRSIFHALNQKAVAKRFAKSIQRPYQELNLIVTHLGGGISVGCHRQGLVVEVNNALDGDGPFTPERAGTLPAGQLGEWVLSGSLSGADLPKMLAGKAGLVAHLGTNDVRQVEARIADGDAQASAVFESMIYNIARAIAACAVPVCGKVDHILLTGGIAHSRYLTEKLKEYVSFIAPVTVIPGEDELQALAEGAYRVLSGEETAREYL